MKNTYLYIGWQAHKKIIVSIIISHPLPIIAGYLDSAIYMTLSFLVLVVTTFLTKNNI